MKKVYNIILIFFAAISIASCEREWKDELYERTISFGKNGVADIHVRYKGTGKVTYQLPVVVSGTQQNDKNYTVNVALDPDTLEIANIERFNSRKDLYFRLLDERYYSVPHSVNIKSGENVGLLDIDFSLGDIDMIYNHILPLTIADGNGYSPNYRKHFRKALLNVIPFNDYSGTYSATNASIDDGTGKPLAIDTRLAQVVDEHSIFFYAGLTQEDLIDRATYKIVAKFIPQSAENLDEGTVEFSAPDPRIGFSGTGTFMITRVMDEVTPYLEHIYTTIYLEYEYDELLDDVNKMHYTVSGSMMMERKRNILIPDEDQAWQW